MRLELGVAAQKTGLPHTVNTLDDDHEDLLDQRAYKVALLIPLCGSAGLWAPSCIASAQVAVQELNRLSGIAGRPVQMVMIDSAIESETPVDVLVHTMIENGSIDAIVGMHISAVRQRLTKVVQGRIPYVYTPLYEGGEHSSGVFAIGDTPPKQLGPAMEHLYRRFRLKKWALIGNDYVWPRTSHNYAKGKIASLGAELVFEKYLPFSCGNLEDYVDQIGRSGADGVLVSLVGQDAVDFNRIFGALELHKRIVRLSCAMEENGLLASGEENLQRLFSSASYFAALSTAENANFREKYHTLHRDRAPMLNALGQSTYEGFQFLSSLMEEAGGTWRGARESSSCPVSYKSARQSIYISNSRNTAPVYLARANGVVFDEFEKIQ
ncbi:substrate-binding domain-containing protein [Nitratireductor sp. XY-223]|uniref:substrate-binding domain-containing protein n=1 Tax=Nitratireductor sp. XY-223 TaxID=2561926 RepID=UPI0010AA3650|nr:substrate-binding domain-containing protein [Nitratireductor sp. XY-223]